MNLWNRFDHMVILSLHFALRFSLDRVSEIRIGGNMEYIVDSMAVATEEIGKRNGNGEVY